MPIIDLTHKIYDGMPTYPRDWHARVETSRLGRHGIEGRQTHKIVLGTHTGTHIDAPSHAIALDDDTLKYDIDILVGSAILIDLSTKKDMEQVHAGDLSPHLKDIAWDRIILRYDWDRYYGNMRFWDQHPFLTESAAQLIIDHGCSMIGMDTPSPDAPWVPRMTIHEMFLDRDIMILECLSGLKRIGSGMFDIIVAPLAVDLDGAPARVFGIHGDRDGN